ncbi:hypothetical protein Pan14r_26680 [Crateriforma conspicua]|uniref:Uncharacterized protein n=1 Tax=Crateriforma conspicua TaxID=2527996 RepID=A0A5C5YAM9_9PLAN|nr:hypothetical protein Pan14r_26680 [Crateriforma conspicua]
MLLASMFGTLVWMGHDSLAGLLAETSVYEDVANLTEQIWF